MYMYLPLMVTQPSKMQDTKQYVHVMYMYLPLMAILDLH